MRVAHYCKNFSPLSETFIYDYVTELEHQGVDNHVFTRSRENVEERPFEKVHVVDQPSRFHPRRIWRRALAAIGLGDATESATPLVRRAIRRSIEDVQPDVIHAHFGPAAVLVAPIANRLRVPLVASFHGYDAFRLPTLPEWRQKYRRLFAAVSAVTVVSHLMEKKMIELGCPSELVHVVRVGKRASDYPMRAEPSWPIRRWITVGRFCEKKSPLECIEAFEGLLEHDAEQQLTMIGDGPLFKDASKYVSDRGLGDRIRLTGPLPHDEVRSQMSAADAFILCSKTDRWGDREGVPTVLMEAQALGLPCVTTWHSGIPEVIPEENQWLLADEGHVEQIAARMHALHSADQSVLAGVTERGRRKVEGEFNLVRECERLRRLYDSVVA